ncbi:hypothetical protein K8R43_00100 [archaeon]|nr:hypothetical protein [archaeon]
MKRAIFSILILSLLLFTIGCTEPQQPQENETGPVCQTEQDCQGMTPTYLCDGVWACIAGQCQYICSQKKCLEDRDCENIKCETNCELGEPSKECIEGTCTCRCPEEIALKELHEWGVIVGCANNTSAFATNRPEKEEEFQYPVKQPVIYLHGRDGITFNLTVNFTNGTPTDTYPEAEVTNSSVSWTNVKIGKEKMGGNKATPTEELVPLSSILDQLNNVDASTLTYNEKENNFLFYEGMIGFETGLNVSYDNQTVTIKNNRENAVHNTRFVLGIEEKDTYGLNYYLANFNTIKSGEEKTINLENLSVMKIGSLLIELEEKGFTEKESRAFEQIWFENFFNPGKPFNHIIYSIEQEEYDLLFPLTVEPAPEKTVRTMYVLLQQDTPDCLFDWDCRTERQYCNNGTCRNYAVQVDL